MVSTFRILFKDQFDLNVLPAFVSPEKYSFQQTLLQTHLPCSQLAFPCASTNIFNCPLPLIDRLTRQMPAACLAWELAACVQRQEWWLADGRVSGFPNGTAFDEALSWRFPLKTWCPCCTEQKTRLKHQLATLNNWIWTYQKWNRRKDLKTQAYYGAPKTNREKQQGAEVCG